MPTTEGGFREKCGVVGVFGHPEAANLAYLGLCALQHRGQEAAGIVSSDGQVLVSHRGLGLVTDIFPEAIVRKLRGRTAIGHNRYSTTGASQHLKNAQPLVVEYGRGGLALAHNGNLVNAERLRAELEARGAIFQSTVDTEVIIHLIAAAAADTLEDRVVEALHQVRGAYSLVFLSPHKLIAVRDPHGFRPLVLGRVKGAWVIASETCALDLMDAGYEREIEPGEMVVASAEGLVSYHPFVKAPGAACIFEHIYFARPDSTVFGRSVYQARKELGRTLARESGVPADIVIPVPDSGVPAAIGYAEAAGIAFEMGLIRNHYVGRTFIEPRDAIRHFGVKVKLNAQRNVLEGKRVVVVDDSIVRGTTSRKIVKMIRDAGAREVHMRISSPPTTNPCYYGIDTPTRAELIASSHDIDEICRYITADSLRYLTEEGMYAFLGGRQPGFCDACFTGRYPVPFEDTGAPRQLVLFDAQDER
ncbi:MAG: amidophosphoribosyltransferase [Deltaproteobacteria bacterium]|nr:amidophosphoribosyltransferase [Deltaproteobacteria bacterium]